MEYLKALRIAKKVVNQLKPYCTRIEIGGSIRRKKPFVKDIEVICIPKPDARKEITSIIEQWEKIKGTYPCKYTQRVLPEGINLDLFFAEPGNWGVIFALRTGSANFSHKVIAVGWVKKGFRGEGGYLVPREGGQKISIREEKELFDFIGIPFIAPELRT